MKKKSTLITTVSLIVCTVVLCLWYLWKENIIEFGSFKDNSNPPAANRTVEDENVAKFIESMKETGQGTIKPEFVSSIGNSIGDGQFEYTVLSYEIQKENPGYPYPEGMTPLSEKPGAVIDENGNITNEFSYLVMNVDVKNLSEEDGDYAVWGMITLRFPGVSSDLYSKELTYLGEAEPRFKGGDYYMEHIPAGEHIAMPLIFVVKDELLEGEYAPYLRINSSGTANTEPGHDVTRYITLNK